MARSNKSTSAPAPEPEDVKPVEQGPVEQTLPAKIESYDVGAADAGVVAIARLSDDEFAERMKLAKIGVDRINQIVQSLLQQGTDYDTLPGVKKPILLQEGATQLCRVFRYVPTYDRKITYGKPPETPAVTVESDCKLHLGAEDGPVVGAAGGACTSHEARYRYRTAKRKCPACEAECLNKSKFKPEYYCYAKAGGCGQTFALDHPAIVNQVLGQVENPDPLDQLETILQVADKRALVMAVRRATGAGRLFTQDEDVLQAAGVGDKHPPYEDRIETPQGPARAAQATRVQQEPQDERKPAPPPQDIEEPHHAPGPPRNRQRGTPGRSTGNRREPEPVGNVIHASGAFGNRLLPPPDEWEWFEGILDAEAPNQAGNVGRVFTLGEKQKALEWASNIRFNVEDPETKQIVKEQHALDTWRRFVIRSITEYMKRTGTRYTKPVPPPIAKHGIELVEEE